LLKTVPNVRPAKTPVSLYFDKKTNLLFKFEFSIDFPSMGESIAEYSFSDYRPHPHLIWFPANRSIKLNGNIWRTMNYKQVLVDSSQAETMLRLPPELEGFITPPGTVKEIAKGVYLVYRLGGYQPMFVEFKDFVVAFEAPAAHPFLEDTPIESLANPNALSEEFIAKIKQTIKDKPIKYVVPTHYHSDHAGGIRAFATENSTVLTTPGNKAFFEKFAPNMKVETFENKRTLSDGERIVDLINVGANPHTKENIVVYLPREKYLYQGDLFYFGGDTTFPIRDRLMVMPFFAAWLRKMASLPREFTAFIAFHSGRCNTFTGF
jgi:glyoxylase-like metal-dependent hydrolase (beta-lactamase superfamily II)